MGMTGIDQTLQRGRPAIGILDRIPKSSVVSPTMMSGELRDRQNLYGSDS
jgi:hypothetical protein